MSNNLQGSDPVGRSLVHDSAGKHVTGEAEYVDDRAPINGQLYACVGASNAAHGEIKKISLAAVKAAEGVIDVITAEDIPGQLDIGPVFPGDPLLASGRVEYVGQPVFAVLATSHQLARRAATLGVVEVEPIPATLSLQQAIDDAHYVRPPHRMERDNLSANTSNSSGNMISGSLRVGGQEHFYLEGQASVAIPQEDGGISVYTSTQNPTEAQKLVAEVLGIAMHQVTVITRRMGGGFGGKETHGSAWSCIAAVFAIRNSCPVSFRLSRQDDMVMTGKRHNFLNTYEVSYDHQGRIQHINFCLAAQCGYSPDLSDAIVDRAMFHCDNAYFYPSVRIDGLRCKTNTVSNTAFRGFGGPQGMIAAETVIDEIAHKVGKDPLQIRKLNFYDCDSRNITPYHQSIEQFPIPRMIEQLEQEADYWGRRCEIDAFNKENPILKRGLALTPVKFGISFTVSHLNQAGALIHIYTDGSVQLNHGGTEMGQGLMVKVAQIVANALGISIDRIKVTATSTDKVPNTSPTAASSGTDINGMAALNAANTLKQRLVGFLAETYSVQSTDIEFANDHVSVGGNNMSFSEVAHAAWLGRVSLSATGFYRTPKIHYDRETASGRPFFYFANGVAMSEVVIDTLTGENKVTRVDILHDVGNSINPAVDIGQIEGGYIQGLGWLTTEELKWDQNGKLLTDSPANYKIPAIGDTPKVFNVKLLENADNSEATVFRSKAVGEPPLMLAISAWCAIRDAIGAAATNDKFPPLNAPATAEEVLRCINIVRELS